MRFSKKSRHFFAGKALEQMLTAAKEMLFAKIIFRQRQKFNICLKQHLV
jgi:hypothetical protein